MIKNNLIARITTILISPLITFYSLYILLNGEDSPGGGFQSGAIFATNIILLDMVGFLDKARTFRKTSASPELIKTLIFLSALGVLLYLSIGLLCIFLGGNFLDYSVLSNNKLIGQHIGIFIIEIGIAITVACVLSLLYFSFKLDDGNV
jgi:multicomponent Na+:H+ antiporter subunit B